MNVLYFFKIKVFKKVYHPEAVSNLSSSSEFSQTNKSVERKLKQERRDKNVIINNNNKNKQKNKKNKKKTDYPT